MGALSKRDRYKVIIHYYLRLLWSFHSSTHCDSGHNVSKWDMNPSFWLMRLWISKQNLNAFSSLSQDVLLWAKSKCFHLCLVFENAEKKNYKSIKKSWCIKRNSHYLKSKPHYMGTCCITCAQQSVCKIKIKDISVAQISILDQWSTEAGKNRITEYRNFGIIYQTE